MVVVILFQVYYYTAAGLDQQNSAWLVKLEEYNAALAATIFMVFLGFADDVLELRWRYKVDPFSLLPQFCSIRLTETIFAAYTTNGCVLAAPDRICRIHHRYPPQSLRSDFRQSGAAGSVYPRSHSRLKFAPILPSSFSRGFPQAFSTRCTWASSPSSAPTASTSSRA